LIPSVPLYLVLGVLAGLFIAVLPGVGSVGMLGILVPIIFRLHAEQGLPLLLGFVAAGVMGDSIPAILLGIPGSASSQATVIDGYAMTRKGEASRALGASFSASMLGGLFGAMVLTLAIPVMRPIVLIFGPPEFFMMVLWGLSMIAILSGSSPLKGFIAGGLGLLMGMIGVDPNLGIASRVLKNAMDSTHS